jgi:uncharacterized protein YqjF (DUF2071 family)
MAGSFLTAEWRDVLMLNYEVPPELLLGHVPRGTELDLLDGKALISIVGFRFLKTRVYGIPIPGHGAFEEVNLRFYVRSQLDRSRRGVVFIKEIVPRHAVTWIARALYEENYHTHRMNHALERGAGHTRVRYGIDTGTRRHLLHAVALGEPAALLPGSETEFIAEHYYGYTKQADGGTVEYRVDHPSWLVHEVRDAELDFDVPALYGELFAPFVTGTPRSALFAVGSKVSVASPSRLALGDAVS